MRHRSIAVAGIALAVLIASVTIRGQAPAPAAAIWAGVYTAAQATGGEATYTTTCSRCHNPDLSGGQVGAATAPPLAGDKFLSRWETNNVDRLFRTIRDTMPRGTPGILNDETALQIVAYILKYNGFPAGSQPLTPASETLGPLVFVPKDGVVAKREVGNFAQVEASGCLAESPNHVWTLVSATDPVPARAGAFGASVSTAQLGTQTLRLVSVAPFRSKMEAGRAVAIKGLIRKDPDATLINVTDMAATGAACAN